MILNMICMWLGGLSVGVSIGLVLKELNYMRRIDADKLLEEVEEKTPLNWTDSEAEIQEQNDYECFKNMIINQPTVAVDESVKQHVKNIFTELHRIMNKYLNDAKYSVGELMYEISELEERYEEDAK